MAEKPDSTTGSSEENSDIEVLDMDHLLSSTKTASVAQEEGESNSTSFKDCGPDQALPISDQTSPIPGGIDRLLQRHKNEIMYELRRLQHGDRPVTGQGNKEAVEGFFQRAMSTDPPPNTDTHRPEHVVVEVEALVERRPVSSLLQSGAFRRNIETALRGAINSIQPQVNQLRASRSNTRTSPAAVPPPPPLPGSLQAAAANGLSLSDSSLSSYRTTNSGEEPQPIRVSEEMRSSIERIESRRARRPQVIRSALHNELLQHHHRAAEHTVPTPHTSTAAEQPVPTPRTSRAASLEPTLPANAARSQQPSGPMRAQAWLQQVPLPNPQEQVQLNVWDSLEQSQREGLIEDISELVQRQLVTERLDGQFRTTMERHLRGRLETTGANGRRVQQIISGLPPSHRLRNDFSDLGILGPQFQQAGSDNLDEISVISATAAVTVPYAQSNTAMCREMQSLKAQLAEMRNMMRVSFDLQLDIQRSIRQEVAAAISAALIDTPATGAPINTRVAGEGQCVICLEAASDAVLYQCGHMCVCMGCGLQLRARGAHCPMCRAPIKDIIRAYKCGNNPS